MNVQFRIFDEDLSGASVDLEENKKYRVGNSMEFDIFIPSIQSNNGGITYFDFSIEGEVINFFEFAEKIKYIDFSNHTENMVDKSYTYEVPCLFEFMGVKFALCDEQDSWEKWWNIVNTKPEQIQQKINEIPEMSEAEVGHINELYQDNAEQVKSATFSSPFLQKAAAFLKSNNLLPNLKLSSKNKKIFIMTCAGTFLFLLIIIALFATRKYTQDHSLKNQNVPSVNELQAIKQIEVNLPTRFNNLKFMSNKSDLVVIMGVVKNQDDINFIQNRFAKFSKIVHFRLLTADEAIRKLNLILKTQNITLVTSGFNSTTYRLYLNGLLANMDAINDIELAVSNQIPEVSDLDTSQVYSIADVERDIDDLVSKNNLTSRLTIKKNLNTRSVYISGYLTQNEINDLAAGSADIATKYQGLIKINLDVKDALASLPFKIAAVNTSGFPSFMTHDGRKVFEGGEIDGMKVDKITPTEIVFSGKFPLVVKLDDLMGTTPNNNSTNNSNSNTNTKY